MLHFMTGDDRVVPPLSSSQKRNGINMIPQRLDLTMNFHLSRFLPFWFHKFHCLTLSHVLLGSSTVSIIIYLFEKPKIDPLFHSFHSDLFQLFVSFGPCLEKRDRKDYPSGCFISFVIPHSIMSLFFNPRGQFHIPHLGACHHLLYTLASSCGKRRSTGVLWPRPSLRVEIRDRLFELVLHRTARSRFYR